VERILLKSKIHRATVTAADVHYQGSISIGPSLLQAADIVEFEQVQVYNVTTGARFTTYAISGEDEGQIQINGAAAHLARPGDRVIVASYASYGEKEIAGHKPLLVYVSDRNRIERVATRFGRKETRAEAALTRAAQKRPVKVGV